MCFAYKVTKPLEYVTFYVRDSLGNTLNANAYLNNTIADFNWHYTCVDLYAALKASQGGSSFTTLASKLTLVSVCLCLFNFIQINHLIKLFTI